MVVDVENCGGYFSLQTEGLAMWSGASQNRRRAYMIEGKRKTWRDRFMQETLCVGGSEVPVKSSEVEVIHAVDRDGAI